MKDLTRVWKIYLLAKVWEVRASELLGIEDAYTAYCFDEAVAEVGTTIAAELDKVEGKNQKDIERKKAMVLAKWFGSSMTKHLFRAPEVEEAKREFRRR